MASKSVTKVKKDRTKWDPEVERKLIDIWADILTEYDGQMMSRKKKEAIATGRLNRFIAEELDNKVEVYEEKAVCYKVDSFMRKGKSMYTNYQRKGETGKPYEDSEADVDREAAEVVWPNFKTFFDRFHSHPALGSGSVEDSATTPSALAIGPTIDIESELLDCTTPVSSRSASRLSDDTCDLNKDHEGFEDLEDEEVEYIVPAKKRKQSTTDTPVARVGKGKGKAIASSSKEFISSFGVLQQESQIMQQEHEVKLQQQMIEFQQRLEADREKSELERRAFEAKLATDLQQQHSLFQMNIMQQNQMFQAELFKKLFEKKDE